MYILSVVDYDAIKKSLLDIFQVPSRQPCCGRLEDDSPPLAGGLGGDSRKVTYCGSTRSLSYLQSLFFMEKNTHDGRCLPDQSAVSRLLSYTA